MACAGPRGARFVALAVLASLLAACGGGGSPASRADTFFVRSTRGNDADLGTSPATALRTIQAALDRSTDGDTIVVGPGIYKEALTITTSGTASQPIILLADPSGALTGDSAASVTVDAATTGEFAAFHIRNTAFIIVDGFRVTGASGNNAAGIVIRNGSRQITIRNCEVTANDGDGIRVQDSADVLLFNNLVYDNSARGIALVGTVTGVQRSLVINNTVVANMRRGIEIGTSTRASRDAFLRNNVVQDNTPENIRVATGPPSSLDGYNAQYNLVFPPTYNPPTLPRSNDLNVDAALTAGFRLSPGSPAVDAGTTDLSAMPSGGPLVNLSDLRVRSAVAGSSGDDGPIDLGYHFPVD